MHVEEGVPRPLYEDTHDTFSVIAATYNRCDTFLDDYIASVHGQRYIGPATVDYEHVVVNNGSTDGTADYLQGLVESGDYPELKVVTLNENVPVGAAWNEGLAATGYRGEKKPNQDGCHRVIVMGDDDLLFPHSIQVHANELNGHPQVGFSFGIAELIDDEGQPHRSSTVDYDGYKFPRSAETSSVHPRAGIDMPFVSERHDLLGMLWHGNQITPGTAAMSRQAILDVGGWKEQPEFMSPDLHMYMSLLANKVPFGWYIGYVSKFRVHDEQLSAASDIEENWVRDFDYIRRDILNRYAGAAAMLLESHYVKQSELDSYSM